MILSSDTAAFISTRKKRDMMDYYRKRVLDNLQPPVLSRIMKRKGIRIKRRKKKREDLRRYEII
jgi:hypothetical protein